MNLLKKPIAWVVIVGIGIVTGVVTAALNLDEEMVLRSVVMIGLLVMAGSFFYNHLYLKKYAKRIQACTVFLEELRPQEYVEKMTEIYRELEQAKHNNLYLKSIVGIDLCAGYHDMKMYDQALEVLLANDSKYIKGLNRVIYNLNLCSCYFNLGQTDLAMKCYEENTKGFKDLRKIKSFSGHIAILDIWVSIAKQSYEAAQRQLNEAKEQWDQPRLREEYRILQEKIDEKNI